MLIGRYKRGKPTLSTTPISEESELVRLQYKIGHGTGYSLHFSQFIYLSNWNPPKFITIYESIHIGKEWHGSDHSAEAKLKSFTINESTDALEFTYDIQHIDGKKHTINDKSDFSDDPELIHRTQSLNEILGIMPR